jgi:hypothetical protein
MPQKRYHHLRSSRFRTGRTVAAALLVAAAAPLLGACEGDTLYDGEILEPGTAPTPQRVSVASEVPPRVERTDSIEATVSWRHDPTTGGVSRVGVTALVLGPAGDTLDAVVRDVNYGAPRTGTGTETFRFPLPQVGAVGAQLRVEVHAFAVNAAGSCAAAIAETEQRIACRAVGSGFIALDTPAPRQEVVVTEGRTFGLPAGGAIADALVSTAVSPRLYLSNLTNHTVDVLELNTTFGEAQPQWRSVQVGSEPWGLAMDLTGNNLLVANSGGTSISTVPTTTLTENLGARIQTPNTVLWEVTVTTDTLGNPRYEGSFYDFSDRPQFLAQDFSGLLLYSTVPTPAASDGTIRLAERLPGWERPEVRILFTGRGISSSPNHWAIAHIDSLRVFVTPNQDLVNLYDHLPGFPGQFIQSGPLPVEDAIASLAAQGSDIRAQRGQWVIEEVGLSDTTFVAASGDRRYVAFGEGARSPAGRIIMWEAATRTISNEISVADLFGNASERILGLGLNQNGTLGAARGTQGVYFFDPGLRLQGFNRQDGMAGGGGTALRPGAVTASTLSFVGTERNTIRIVGTDHYLSRGEIPIRDRVTGPLRAAEPLPQDNQGMTCPGNPNCVVVKLYGVTSAGGVVVVPVRARDIL